MRADRINDRLESYSLTPADQREAYIDWIKKRKGKEATQAIVRDWYLRERVEVEVVVRAVR